MMASMKYSDEQIHDILKLTQRISDEIEKHKEEIKMLEKNHDILKSIIKESSFTKASDLSTIKTNVNSAAIPITKGNSDEIIANAYVSPEQVSIVLNDEIGLDADTPPLKSFFIDRIIAEMKRKDSGEVKLGKIQPESVIDYVINKSGTQIREIIVKNYRQKERVDEIINTVAWSLSRMLENAK